MKKRLTPSVYRNSIYDNYLANKNIIKKSSIKSLNFFQEQEIFRNMKDFLKDYNISLLNCNLLRGSQDLHLSLNYYLKDVNPFTKISNINHREFTKEIYADVNSIKFANKAYGFIVSKILGLRKNFQKKFKLGRQAVKIKKIEKRKKKLNEKNIKNEEIIPIVPPIINIQKNNSVIHETNIKIDDNIKSTIPATTVPKKKKKKNWVYYSQNRKKK